ncbi:hypothetical protein H1P_280014 [Hyella patelloides LEGE 07179]|uniref:Uncharacterized protein n=1 Tax=Hyella patelloides LEGE 07179 TaxID=945734 RepID=A0A563VTD2_9CYAN|nr:hypothetical protein [Hyella patelloides]VEP14673.1 hypothetical protein H1P_280014 [Hyella patelloides LEGE 07179]
MTTMQIDNETTYLGRLNEAIAASQNLLTNFAFKDGVLADFSNAFGSRFDRRATLALVNQWQNGEFDILPDYVSIFVNAPCPQVQLPGVIDIPKLHINLIDAEQPRAKTSGAGVVRTWFF